MPVEETKNEIRARVQEPSKFKKDTYKRINIDKKKGIDAVVAIPKKGGTGLVVQAYRFDKDNDWDKKKAMTWIKEHKIKTIAVKK